MSLHPDSIDRETFDSYLSRYDQFVPAKLQQLERFRVVELPATLQDRKDTGRTWVEKEELVRLVEWKL
jgi:hypothetical protein